jgi:chromosome segregation ATPase
MPSRSFTSLRALLVALLFALAVPATASAKPPSDQEIDAAAAKATGDAATGIEKAEDERHRAARLVEQREAELAASKLWLESSKMRLDGTELELRAVETDIRAVEAIGDQSAKEELASRRARVDQQRRWRSELVREAKQDVTLAQRLLVRAKTGLKLKEAELERAKLTAWVEQGATPEVDTALAKSSRLVAKHRRTIERDERRIAKQERKVEVARAASDSVRPSKDLETELADSETDRQQLVKEVEGLKRQLEDERGTVSRLSVRLGEERADTSGEQVAGLEQELSTARTAAETGGEAHARELAERDRVIAELREQLTAEDPAKAQEVAALGGEMEALREERDRLTADLAGSEAARVEQAGAIAGLESQLSGAEEAARLTTLQAEEDARQQREQHTVELTSLAEAAEAIAAERDALQAELDALRSDDPSVLAERTRQLEVLRERLHGVEQLSRHRIEGLEAALAVSNSERDNALSRLSLSSDEGDDLAAEAARMRSEVETWQQRAGDAEAALASKTTDFESRIDVLVQRAEDFEDDADQAIAALDEELDVTREQLAQAEQVKAGMQRELQGRGGRIAELESEVERTTARSDETDAALTAEQAARRTEVEELRAALSEEAGDQRARADQAEGDLTAASSQVEQLAEQLAENEAEIASLKSALESTEGQAEALMEELEGRVEDLEGEREDLRAQLSQQREFAALETEALRSQVTELTADRDDKAARLETREQRVAELTEELSTAEQGRREALAALRAELRTVREERDRQRASLSEIEAVLRETKRRLARVDAENVALWSRIDEGIEWGSEQQGG